jgi:hypothetical protein
MNEFYYFLGIAPIIWELLSLMELHKVHAFCTEYKLLNKRKEKVKMSSTQNSFTWLMTMYVVWAIAGLFSSQWFLFLLLLSLSFIPKNSIFIRLLDSCISFVLLLFIVLNRFHFHIDTWAWFKDWI